MRRSIKFGAFGSRAAAVTCAALLALSSCGRSPRPARKPAAASKPTAPARRDKEPVSVTPVTGPVSEVPAEEVVEDETGPPGEPLAAGASPAPARPDRMLLIEPAKRHPKLNQLEKAVAEGAARDASALDPLQAAMLDETLAAGAPSKKAAGGSAEASPGKQEPGAERTRPRLVVYDFESSLDTHSEIGDPLGGKVADILTGHAARSGFFETFAELEQEEVLARYPFAARGDTAAAKIAHHARERFDADIVIWGRVSGKRHSPSLEFFALDLRRGMPKPGPRLGSGPAADSLALRESHDCPNLHCIPIVADRVLEKLAGRPLTLAGARVVRRIGPNLVRNGSFRRKRSGRNVPGWESPLPEGAALEHGRLVLTLTEEVATTHGLGVYSDWLRVEPGVHYELSCRSRQEGVTIIVWARGYAEFPARTPGERGVDPRREAFRHQFRPASQVEPGPDGWMAVTSKPFRPRHFRHEIKWMRVRLYAFGGRAGTAEFDDIVLRKVEVEGAEGEDETMLKAFGEKVGE